MTYGLLVLQAGGNLGLQVPSSYLLLQQEGPAVVGGGAGGSRRRKQRIDNDDDEIMQILTKIVSTLENTS